MIIGIDASRANRSRKTGTEWYSYNLIRQLAEIDSENQYILYSDAPLCGGMADLTREATDVCGPTEISRVDRHGYQAIKSPHGNFEAKILRWPLRFFWTQGRLSLEMIYNRPDMLFVPSHALPIIHPRKSVVTLHDIGFEREERVYKRDEIVRLGLARRVVDILIRLFTLGRYRANTYDYLRWSTSFALRKASKIITISEFSKKEMLDIYQADERKIKVVYNGYDEEIYHKMNDAEALARAKAKYGLPEKYILYTGRLEVKKNIPALIEAFALMKAALPDDNHKLVLAGKAGYGFDEIKYTIREFNLNDDIIMPGWVEQASLPLFYAGATFYVFPSLYEGFGIPLVEAMACGIPVVASNTSSLPEVAGDAAEYFNPKHIKSIADAMIKMVSDADLRKAKGENGLERAKNFGWEKCARETLAELLG